MLGRAIFLGDDEQVRFAALQHPVRIGDLRAQIETDAGRLRVGEPEQVRNQRRHRVVGHEQPEQATRLRGHEFGLGRHRGIHTDEDVSHGVLQSLGTRRGLHLATNLHEQFVVEVFA
ncbi:hypothetical protein NLY09_07435 (plasmid) [Burkholderia vietnamiensis]